MVWSFIWINSWPSFTQEGFVLSLFEIGPVVLKYIFKIALFSLAEPNPLSILGWWNSTLFKNTHSYYRHLKFFLAELLGELQPNKKQATKL